MKMKIKAHAKINLCLNVVGRRNDGYHELEMIMVPIRLHDNVFIERSEQDSFTCSDETLAMNETNTIVKAVHLLREEYNFKECFHIHIEKHIPMQAGLAGGSADAAAVLRGINELLHLGISIDDLAMLGKKVGADVPFCVKQTCAMVKGIGEDITPFPMNCDFSILLVKPDKGVNTGKAFQMLDFNKCVHPNCDIVKTCCEGNDFEGIASSIGNTLEYSAFQMVPEIADIKHKLTALGFPAVLMSGSGSTVFALTRDLSMIEDAKRVFDQEYFTCVTEII